MEIYYFNRKNTVNCSIKKEHTKINFSACAENFRIFRFIFVWNYDVKLNCMRKCSYHSPDFRIENLIFVDFLCIDFGFRTSSIFVSRDLECTIRTEFMIFSMHATGRIIIKIANSNTIRLHIAERFNRKNFICFPYILQIIDRSPMISHTVLGNNMK